MATDDKSYDEPVELDDAVTDKAVDDIVKGENDEVLEAEDAAAGTAPAHKIHRGFWGGLKHGLHSWWQNKPARWLTLVVVFGGIAAVAVVPATRYWVLNTCGVRVSASLDVADLTTGQPLKDVEVTIGQQKGQTGSDGTVKLSQLKLGPQQVTIDQPGFASQQKMVTLGLGSNPLGEFRLKAVGVQYTLQVKDYLTGQAVQGAEASSAGAVAASDKAGKIVLTLPGSQSGDIVVAVTHSGYRTEQLTIKAYTKEPTPVALVTSRKAVFVSRETGTYGVYSSDADGQNKKLLLPGTGNENGNIALAVSPDGSRAALVSTRDNQHDTDGYLLSTLTLIDLSDASITTLAHAEQIQLIDWQGNRLVFEQVSSDTTTSAASRYSIISYDYGSSTRLQLAASSRFSTVFAAQGSIYYAVGADQDPASKGEGAKAVGLYKVSLDGTGQKSALEDKDIWTMYRTDYNTINLQTADGWYTYNLTTGAAAKADAPGNYVSRNYADSGGQSLWAEIRDGQGVLLRYDRSTGKDTVVQIQDGLGYPIRWLTDNAAIYRVVNGGETADYAVSTLGGQPPHKISDVTNTFGFSTGQ